jgi:transposase
MKRDGRSLKHNTLAELRRMAVGRVIEDGAKPSDLAAEYGFCRNYLYRWLQKFRDKGWEALAERWIIGKDPRQYGFDFGLWSRRIVQALIQQKLGVEMGLTAVGRLLASLEITPQKPLRRAYERDFKMVQWWLQEAYPKLKGRAKRQRAKIFFGRSGIPIRSAPGTHLRAQRKDAGGRDLRAASGPQRD